MSRLPRIVAAVFIAAAAVLAVASWDVAAGRAPKTASPLIADALTDPDSRTCTRDVSALVMRHVKPGMTAAEARAVLDAATIELPRPWFWTPRRDDAVTEGTDALDFVRTIRASPFGNEILRGRILLSDGLIASVAAQRVCAFG